MGNVSLGGGVFFVALAMNSVAAATAAARRSLPPLARRGLGVGGGASATVRRCFMGPTTATMTTAFIATPSSPVARCDSGVIVSPSSSAAFVRRLPMRRRRLPQPPMAAGERIRLYSTTDGAEHNNDDDDENAQSTTTTQIVRAGTTVRGALRASLEFLTTYEPEAGAADGGDSAVPEPEESAVHLLAHALDLSWEDGHRQLRPLLGHNDDGGGEGGLAGRLISSEEASLFETSLRRRSKLEPIQYIVGKWDFHSLSGIAVRRPVLCPRPETEELVEWVKDEVRRWIVADKEAASAAGGAATSTTTVRILDVGSGTGAVGIALALALRPIGVRTEVVALDVSEDAVALSSENAHRFLSSSSGSHDGERNAAYRAMLCAANDFTNGADDAPQQNDTMVETMDFDVVVSNPPYIPSSDMAGLSSDVVDYESNLALCGGEDGLDVVRDIVRRLPEWTRSSTAAAAADDNTATENVLKQRRCCWMEVDDSHPRLLEKWLAPGSDESQRLGVEFCERRKDFCGRDRFVKLRAF